MKSGMRLSVVPLCRIAMQVFCREHAPMHQHTSTTEQEGAEPPGKQHCCDCCHTSTCPSKAHVRPAMHLHATRCFKWTPYMYLATSLKMGASNSSSANRMVQGCTEPQLTISPTRLKLQLSTVQAVTG